MQADSRLSDMITSTTTTTSTTRPQDGNPVCGENDFVYSIMNTLPKGKMNYESIVNWAEQALQAIPCFTFSPERIVSAALFDPQIAKEMVEKDRKRLIESYEIRTLLTQLAVHVKEIEMLCKVVGEM